MKNGRKLTRSNNRVLGGVIAGIAEYFGWDITWTRIIFVFLALVTNFPGILAYLIAWVLIPEK